MYLRPFRILITALAITAIAPTAHAADPQTAHTLKISRTGDTEMSCGALSREAALMRDIINTTQTLQDKSKRNSRATAVAGTAAGFLIGTVTGGVGLAAAGFLIDENLAGNANQASTIQNTAQQRRSFIMGIHNAKGCQGPLDHALQPNTKKETLAAANPINHEPATGTYND